MSAIRKLKRETPTLDTGIVERVDDMIEVRLETGTIEAERAKSCLVEPEVGDLVLCNVTRREAFVLAVLRGRKNAGTSVSVDGDLTLRARGGHATLASTEEVNILSGGKLAVCAEKGMITVGEVGFLSNIIRAEASKVTLLAEQVDSVVTRLHQRMKRALRFVEEIDMTRAGTIDQRAEKLVAIRGENTVIAARALAKIDGEQVKIG